MNIIDSERNEKERWTTGKMRVAVVDAEEIWRKRAAKVIRECSEEEVYVHTFSSGDALLEEKERYEIVVLDIEMPGRNGFRTAFEYKVNYPDAVIMILTERFEFMKKGYLIGAFRYMDKFAIYEEMKEALSSARKLLKRDEVVHVNSVNRGDMPIVLKDIVYIETGERNVLVHTYNRVHECKNLMRDLERELSGQGFFRCHKSFIVNLDAITRIEKTCVHLAEGKKAMVGARRYALLKKKYIERIKECANL